MARTVVLGLGLMSAALGCGPNGSPPTQPWPFDSAPTINAPQSSPSQINVAAIRALYDRYQAALKAKDGPAVADCLNQSSIDRIEQLRTAALEMKRDALAVTAEMEPQRAILILRMRLDFDQALLAKSGSRDLAARCAERDWFGIDFIAEPLHAVRANDMNRAHATLFHPPSNDEVPRFFFSKDPEGWKVDWFRWSDRGNAELLQIVKQTGKMPIDFVRERIQATGGEGYWKEQALEGPLEKP